MSTAFGGRAVSAVPDSHIGRGRVLCINVSPGGVPKLPVAAARITRLGLEGDGHHALGAHGGPMRAVSLLANEAIRRVAAEGHPLAPGGAGENLTTEGVEISLLPVGTVLEVGDSVRLELTGAALPCKTIRFNFLEGRFGRLSPVVHPADGRMYARVLAEGEIRPGDEIRVLGVTTDPEAGRERMLYALSDTESSSAAEMWRAAADAGFDVRLARDGDFVAAAAPGLPGGAFNKAHGLDYVPIVLPAAIEHFRAAGTVGWLEMREPPSPGEEPELSLDLFGAATDAVPDIAPPEGVTIRRARPEDTAAWDSLFTSAEQDAGPPAGERDAWRAITAARLRSPRTELFLADADGRAVGAAMLHVGHRAGWLRSAAVVPSYRRRGIHRALIAARVQAAGERGCDVVGGSAVPDSQSAANFRALGFTLLGTRGHYRVHGTAPAGTWGDG